MVRDLERTRSTSPFPASAPAANSVFYRTYSRRGLKDKNLRETWGEVSDRVLQGLLELGNLAPEEVSLIERMQRELKSLTSGRWLWVGGTTWIRKPENYSGAYNCTSTNVTDWRSFGLMMDLAMMGSGTGAVLEPKYISQLPAIRNRLEISLRGEIGTTPKEQRRDRTSVKISGNQVEIIVGDSRQGWVSSYQTLLELSSDDRFTDTVQVAIDLSDVRPAGETLSGFGGVANPVRLPGLYERCAKILNRAIDRQLTSVECCLLIDEAAVTIVAGNIRRSAGIRQGASEDFAFSQAKDNLWQQDGEGNWRIDPDRDSLRMANHTRVFHRKPTLEECTEAVRKQYYSGEGAIQWAGEAIARSNRDLLNTPELKAEFLKAYSAGNGEAWLQKRVPSLSQDELSHRLGRYGLNPCGEIIGENFHCNLSEVHLNQLDPSDRQSQIDAFRAGALSVAVLLHHQFQEPRYQYSREIDPIVGVSFTGLFDFFVHAFGVEWLRWWEQGRPDTMQGLEFKQKEQEYLTFWRETVHQAVWEYCDRNGLKRPNRCTTVQPAGCLSREALRIFDSGLLYADELMAPGSGETALDLTVRQGVAVKTGIANQPLTLIKITLANGRSLRMTPNHRLSCQGEWIYAAEMMPGMQIDFSLGEYRNSTEALLQPPNPIAPSLGRPCTPIRTPEVISPELGYWLGALFGDGSISPHKHRVRFTNADFKLLDRLSYISDDLFGLKGVVHPDSRGGRSELVLASRPLLEWLKLNGLEKNAKSKFLDRIPLAVRQSSRQSILSFFCGLIDTDGHIREAGSMVISSASELFLRNLQQIGEAVGLCFSIYQEVKGQNLQAQKSMWHLSLSRMLSNVDAIEYLNAHSIKAQDRAIPLPKRQFTFNPYQIAAVEWQAEPDYSYDVAVEGVNDDDAWYWQGGLKSHNTKSLLTGASAGWHPPKAQRFIRRITFRKNDPVALACLDYGYSIVPSQSDKDEQGNLLNDPFDPRCTEWLVEIPVEVSWASLPGADEIAIEQFSAIAQTDFYMQVQKHYTTHNTSATIELREDEIDALAERIYQAIDQDEGYISAALLARFDAPFPRLPFEKIDRSTYVRLQNEVRSRQQTDDFYAALARYDSGETVVEGPAGCDSDKCMMPEKKGE